MPGEKHGEHIYLTDEGGGMYTDEVAVKGHVTPEEFEAAIAEEIAEYEVIFDDREFPELSEPEHKYAFWAQTAYHEGMTFMVRNEPGRGRFPVTVAEDMSIVRSRRKLAATQKAAREWVENRYPGVEIISVMGARVRFKFPGGEYPATLHSHADDEECELFCANADVDAWNAYHAEQVV